MQSIRHKQGSPANTKGGYSLVEVLVAITVLLIALVGPLTIAQVGLKRALNSREQTMSVFLAQEGIETLFKLRENSALSAFPNSLNNLSLVWGSVSSLANRCTVANPCGVQIGNNGVINTASFYNCNSSNCKMRYDTAAAVPYRQGILSGVETIYERKLVISIDNDKAIIKSTVSWGTKPEQKVSLETYVYNIYYEPPI